LHYTRYDNYLFSAINLLLSQKDEGTVCSDAIETKAESEKDKSWTETVYLEK